MWPAKHSGIECPPALPESAIKEEIRGADWTPISCGQVTPISVALHCILWFHLSLVGEECDVVSRLQGIVRESQDVSQSRLQLLQCGLSLCDSLHLTPTEALLGTEQT